jgi:hypothetical protein
VKFVATKKVEQQIFPLFYCCCIRDPRWIKMPNHTRWQVVSHLRRVVECGGEPLPAAHVRAEIHRSLHPLPAAVLEKAILRNIHHQVPAITNGPAFPK